VIYYKGRQKIQKPQKGAFMKIGDRVKIIGSKVWDSATCRYVRPIRAIGVYTRQEDSSLVVVDDAGTEHYADHWDVSELTEEKPIMRTADEEVTCSCGHRVAKGLEMSTSIGSSCPGCYDRMSK
jgi:hypothetical protein